MMKQQGNLFVLSGPSGVGKGTVLKKVLEYDKELVLSVSATTRKPRSGEIENISYFFVSDEEFNELQKNDELLETASHFGNRYGTLKSFVFNSMNNGKNVLLEIDTVGALQVKAKMPNSVLIFLDYPSKEELLIRLKGRGSEDEETIKARIEKADIELKERNKYDYHVVNDFVEIAAEKVLKIIRSKKV